MPVSTFSKRRAPRLSSSLLDQQQQHQQQQQQQSHYLLWTDQSSHLMLAAWCNKFATKNLASYVIIKKYIGYNHASFRAAQGKLGITTMRNGGEYISVWPRSESGEWRDPITHGSNNKPASRTESIAAKHAEDGRARARGYSAAEAAQDARRGAWLTAWPAGEDWDIPSVSM